MRDTVHHRASMCDIEDFPLRACDMRVLPHFRDHPDRVPCACDAAIVCGARCHIRTFSV